MNVFDFNMRKRVRDRDGVVECDENMRIMRFKVEVERIVVFFKFFVVRVCLLDGFR